MTPRDPQHESGKAAKSAKQDKKESLLKKKVAELTREDLLELMKPLGTTGLPFPMWGTQKIKHEGGAELGQALTFIEEDPQDGEPLIVLSEKSFDEAWGIIARELPTPSMLPIFREMLERMAPDSKNRQFFVMGDPGMGKSFMGGMIGRVMSRQSPRVYDCGGKQMNSMLFEMVLDFGAGDGPAALIDQAMMDGKLKPASVSVLRTLADEINTTDKKYIAELADGVFEIDWEAIGRESEIGLSKIKIVEDMINTIIKLEGFDKGGTNMLGMNSQFGPMITDFVEGNFATYDEYNKSKQGGDDALQTVLQFINGEIDECTVENPLKGKDGTSGPTEFTFRREDVKAGWGILFTGNKSKDGATTRALNKSVYSRLGPRDLPEVSQEDWQHRICQLMTGVPISTWYHIMKEDADANPDDFADFLWHIRTSGLTEDQVNAIPQSQKVWLQNWQRVNDAAEKLGNFFFKWRDMLDVERAAYVYHLGDEIDDDFSAEQSLDFRRVIKILQKASKPRAKLKAANSKTKIPTKTTLKKAPVRDHFNVKREDQEMDYGTRLTEILINDIFESSGAMGKEALYAKLLEEAENCAIIQQEFNGDAERSQVKTIEQLLNITEFDNADIRIQAKIAQEIFCKMLRERHPEIEAANNEIVTIDRMVEIIQDMRSTAEAAREEQKIAIQNTDINTVMDKPLAEAKMLDYADISDFEDEPSFYDVLTLDEFLSAFVIPGVTDKNFNGIWDNNLTILTKIKKYSENKTRVEEDKASQETKLKDLESKLSDKQDELNDAKTISSAGPDDIKALEEEVDALKKEVKDSQNMISNLLKDVDRNQAAIERIEKDGMKAVDELEKQEKDTDSMMTDSHAESISMAENRSKSGIGLTTIFCRVDDAGQSDKNAPPEYTPVHVLRHAKTDRTVIIGDAISETLKDAFKKAKINYVDFSQDGAETKINNAIDEMIRGMDAETLQNLNFAFSYRNTVDKDKLEGRDLGNKIVSSRKVVHDDNDDSEVGAKLKMFYKTKPKAA